MAAERNTHLLDWLADGWTHCQHGTREWCEGYLQNAAAVIADQDAELSRSREAEKRLREALEPFGKALDVLGRNRHELHDKETIRGYGPDLAITMGDLRRALATVEGRET
ncbi:MAG: hypothetical protein E5X94_00810 [Mesorhizobium sp.]|uniref:hypothetical protein n=1 Tax=Mesorhizobium sp. TaxID=1871066 RepID=UPI001203C975|nr:hypothetical protein [Mesorhizobium sp.]TIN82725.1 MAG: hypothetical protein E5X97_28885 [Mesorhizobium sp.]TIN88378.1 MAG: hypothetical protein E5X94_00810 [Mesorhizobium sp.]